MTIKNIEKRPFLGKMTKKKRPQWMDGGGRWRWQRISQCLCVVNVDMSHQSGWESAQAAIVGILFMRRS